MPSMLKAGATVLIAVVCVMGFAAVGSGAVQPSQDQFESVKSLPQQEQLSAAPLLVAAYAFVWAVLLVYVWTIWRRLMRVERDIQQLSSRMADHSARQ